VSRSHVIDLPSENLPSCHDPFFQQQQQNRSDIVNKFYLHYNLFEPFPSTNCSKTSIAHEPNVTPSTSFPHSSICTRPLHSRQPPCHLYRQHYHSLISTLRVSSISRGAVPTRCRLDYSSQMQVNSCSSVLSPPSAQSPSPNIVKQ
jgi:hypothetical protein